jgi:hypothetical protein
MNLLSNLLDDENHALIVDRFMIGIMIYDAE